MTARIWRNQNGFRYVEAPFFVYQLLNPGDEDMLTVLASEKRELKVYARGEGVSLDVRSASEDRSTSWLLITSGLIQLRKRRYGDRNN
jgi:hypothetical protein